MNLSTVITLLAHYSDDAEFVDATVDLLNSEVWKRWQGALNKEETILNALAQKVNPPGPLKVPDSAIKKEEASPSTDYPGAHGKLMPPGM